MAKRRAPDPPPGADTSGNSIDMASGPIVPDAPAGETMPIRAAKLSSQNATAMRSAFAYLLDEDDTAPPPPKKKR